MRIKIWPETKLGKWSVWLIIAMAALVGVFFIFIALGERGGDTFFSNLYLTIPMMCAGISGIASFVTGLIGIIKDRDFSVLIFVPTIIGFLVLLYIIAEFAFPH